MGELIDDLLELSRVGRAELRRRRVDLSALARGIAAELERAAPDRLVQVVIADGVAGGTISPEKAEKLIRTLRADQAGKGQAAST